MSSPQTTTTNDTASSSKPERPPKVDGPSLLYSQNSQDITQNNLNVNIKVPKKK
ncbi:hypothetical protein [Acinetobacter baumannii]|uniref:hypothetical protein n=1 Tax=Acinetobacter baumannii TaxID=470 RepID=UPI003FA49F6E